MGTGVNSPLAPNQGLIALASIRADPTGVPPAYYMFWRTAREGGAVTRETFEW